ncbi:hypothetical protein SISNIDRAFT_468481 [Sistotremastrum niveocremeum HHB9708]|uniref:Uncharacterized protein n=1 Tax=Sistotremastrum niveocremeum HHB9708 TaxID=1314777 RepID=A0A164RAW4_9AGAM|nr:hypothetical protein SISNIDRAFT_468481 [Sistotremastrum niveocremeum HHB9708]
MGESNGTVDDLWRSSLPFLTFNLPFQRNVRIGRLILTQAKGRVDGGRGGGVVFVFAGLRVKDFVFVPSSLVIEQETSMFHSSIKKTLRLEPYAHIRPVAQSYLPHDSQDSILYLYRSTQNLVWELARRRQRVLRTASRESGTCSVAIVL